MTLLLLNVFIIGFLATICSAAFRPEKDKEPLSNEERGLFVHKHQCGGLFKLENVALLEAKFFPDELPFHKECFWSIEVPYGYNIAMITNSLNTEESINCHSNYVAVRDGKDRDGTIMGVFCGNKTPPILRTVDNGILVKFVNSNAQKNSSFSATVIKVLDHCVDRIRPTMNSFVMPKWWHPESTCGKTFGPTETKGTITSPCYPGFYPRNKACVWKISAPVGVKINLNFKVFDVILNEPRNGEVCRDAFLEIYSMQGNTVMKKHGKFCGTNLPSPIISEGNSLELVFRSNSMYNHELFGFVTEFSHSTEN